ncbi:MAG: hypothetical protein J0M16_02305 [Gammaproteobacteria bacterium]|nr:hypothetical protein [Gammaproteobacteria bacterium]
MATVLNVSNDAVVEGRSRYVDLPVIVGGALVATAISLILAAFGSSIGLSSTSAEPGDGLPLRWVAIAAGLWVLWMAVSSAAAGAYFAGRMRKLAGDSTADEIETRDGAHGVATWALATIITVLLTAAGIGGAAKAVGSAVAGTADTVAAAVSETATNMAGVALRNDRAIASDRARREFAGILVRSLGDERVSEEDRAYLASVVANETGLSPVDARSRVDQVVANAEEARRKAVEAAEQARIFGVISAFVIAASMLVSGAAAWFAAVLGGQHRNDNISFARFRAGP